MPPKARARTVKGSKSRKPSASPRKWSARVTTTALTLPEGLFTKSAREIALGLRRAAMRNVRLRGASKSAARSPLQSAMAMLNFYVNRAGSNLPPSTRARLQRAKLILHQLFARAPSEK